MMLRILVGVREGVIMGVREQVILRVRERVIMGVLGGLGGNMTGHGFSGIIERGERYKKDAVWSMNR